MFLKWRLRVNSMGCCDQSSMSRKPCTGEVSFLGAKWNCLEEALCKDIYKQFVMGDKHRE
jgi:hypothetical protein